MESVYADRPRTAKPSWMGWHVPFSFTPKFVVHDLDASLLAPYICYACALVLRITAGGSRSRSQSGASSALGSRWSWNVNQTPFFGGRAISSRSGFSWHEQQPTLPAL